MEKTSRLNKLPILSIGFRPFFILASLVAILNPTFWVSSFVGYSEISPFGSTLFWHSHEMIFGFTSALVAGFLLTASSNWTGTIPYKGMALLILISAWCLERLAFFLPLTDFSFLVLSNCFLPLLIILLGIKLYDHPKQKYVFLPLLLALFAAKIFHSAGFIYSKDNYYSFGLISGVALIRFLVFLIAGRVLPFFTRKRLSLENFNVPPKLNLIALLPLILLSVPGVIKFELIYVLILLWAFFANALRGYFMFHKGSLKVPMLMVLHVGLIFMLAGLLIEALAFFYPNFNLNKEALHATMAGGLGIVSIGIMTRVSLGHTGRIIKADKTTVFAYVCIFLGACLRVFIPSALPLYYEQSLHYASGFWTLGFLIFFLKYAGILFKARPDQKVF